MAKEIGKCPHCENTLSDGDIIENEIKGTIRVHYAYVCRKRSKIIGFSSLSKIA